MKIKIIPLIRKNIKIDENGNRVLLNPLEISGVSDFKIEYPIKKIEYRQIEIKEILEDGFIDIILGEYDYHIDLFIEYKSKEEFPSDRNEYKERSELFDDSLDVISIDGLSEKGVSEKEVSDLKQSLREKRKSKCFSIINRGALWYERLSESQKEELSIWYDSWLDVTETLQEPDSLNWINQ